MTLLIALCVATPVAPVPEVYLDCLEDLTLYAESQWHEVDGKPGMGYFGDGISTGNAGIRGTCGMALAYATLAAAGRGDRERLVARVEAALRYAAETHVTGSTVCVDGQRWGDGWQTALWTGTLGMAAAILEEDLPPSLIGSCKRVVAHEADRLTRIPPPSGYRGDSKAEENAWNSNAPALAAAWMSDDPRAEEWLATARRYLVNSYTVPDEDGPLAEWITTTTLHPSHACENHGFFHPSYQLVTGMSLGDSWLMARIVDPRAARRLDAFARHNVLPVWLCLESVLLDSAELAYPSGLDWALHGFGQVSYLAWLSTHFCDSRATWAEARLAHWIRERQVVNGDGRFTGEAVPNGFYREAVMARRVAIAWWHHRFARGAVTEQPPEDRVTHLRDVGVIAYRGPAAFVSVSYGQRLMALVAPSARAALTPQQAFVCPPRYPGILGTALGPATQSRLLDLRVDGAHGFEALLEAEHGPLTLSRAVVAAYPDAIAVIEHARSLIEPRPGGLAFAVGIENHAFTGGLRFLQWRGGEARVGERSGAAIPTESPWLAVDGRIAMVAGPGGEVTYRASSGYNRDGAAEDTLAFAPASSMPRFCIILPGDSASAAAQVSSSVQWAIDGTRAELTFVAPTSGRHTLRLDLPPQAPDALERIPLDRAEASSASPSYQPELVLDGDASTFWVSRRGEAEPGDGPTSERPEWLDIKLEAPAPVSTVVVIPRTGYGPRKVRLELDGQVIYSGAMEANALRVELSEPRIAQRMRLWMTDAYDPSHPDAPRNVQVAEVLLAGPGTRP